MGFFIKAGTLLNDAVFSQPALTARGTTVYPNFYGRPANGIDGLPNSGHVHGPGYSPRDEAAAEEIRKLLGYLEVNQGRLKYGSLRRKGYPLGSGGIESANKFISHVRLKRSGAWWYVERANLMLTLRCAKYNGTFGRAFKNYQQRQNNTPETETASLRRCGGFRFACR